MIRRGLLPFMLSLALLLSGCSGQQQAQNETQNDSQGTQSNGQSETETLLEVVLPGEVEEADFSSCTEITLKDTTAEVSGSGVVMEAGKVKITKGGKYRLSGSFQGQIHVKAEGEQVDLLLAGAEIENDSDAPLRITRAAGVNLILAEGTNNALTDSDTQSAETADRENAALYAKSSLHISGKGSLAVRGSFNHGIFSKQVILLEESDITVEAKNAGIKGEYGVELKSGNVTVTAGGDGLKTETTLSEDYGHILISGGAASVSSEQDGLSASMDLTLSGGALQVTTSGEVDESNQDEFFGGPQDPWGQAESEEQETDSVSSKGVKTGRTLTVSGGSLTVESTDHCVHSAGAAQISGGTLSLRSSAGKGIATHGDLSIKEGEITVKESTEALESKAFIHISGGRMELCASDDAINAGGDTADATGINVSGGWIFADGAGDGLDSNGDFTQSGGTLIIAGPTNAGNGALDFSEGESRIEGGILIAYGAAGMAEYPGESSTQRILGLNVNVAQGELFTLKNEAGEAILILEAKKQFGNLCISLPTLEEGTYECFVGGSCEGAEQGGLYESGASEGGTSQGTVTLSGIVTTVGGGGSSFGGGMQSPGGGMGRPGGFGRP